MNIHNYTTYTSRKPAICSHNIASTLSTCSCMTQQYMFPILNHRTKRSAYWQTKSQHQTSSAVKIKAKMNGAPLLGSTGYKEHINQQKRTNADGASMLISTQYYSERLFPHSQKCSSPVTHFQKSKKGDYPSDESSESSPTTPLRY